MEPVIVRKSHNRCLLLLPLQYPATYMLMGYGRSAGTNWGFTTDRMPTLLLELIQQHVRTSAHATTETGAFHCDRSRRFRPLTLLADSVLAQFRPEGLLDEQDRLEGRDVDFIEQPTESPADALASYPEGLVNLLPIDASSWQ